MPDVCVIMAGGRGTRLSNPDKALIRIGGRTLLEWKVSHLRRLAPVVVCCSLHAARTVAYCIRKGYRVYLAPGRGYPEDLSLLLRRLKGLSVLVVGVDLYIPTAALDLLISSEDGGECITEATYRGQNVPLALFCRERSDGEEGYSEVPLDTFDMANINTPHDLEEARRLWSRHRSGYM
ncbi:TIGR00454 family protein [Thermogymnomonas acidicola]|uniref:TIGR00454 family protein n=1 Tax=Thermogymnomonas acidicola TaxID=399579 RepID=A0AA37BRT9_9ARCH|nr:TIGR00454 family protein [Thermogymnomonas acidicola]